MQMAKLGMVSFFRLTARVAQAQKFVRRGCPAPVKVKPPSQSATSTAGASPRRGMTRIETQIDCRVSSTSRQGDAL
jgi:hypothetical protein